MIDAADLDLFERSVRQATERHTGEALDAALAELGWTDALAADPYAAVSTLFPLLGEANASSSALDQVVATGLGLAPTDEAVVLPPAGSWTPPASLAPGGGLSIRGLATSAALRAERAVVALVGSDRDGEATIATVPMAQLVLRPVRGIDPAAGVVAVVADAVELSPDPSASDAPWGSAVALAQLALSYEILGAARTMLSLAREHAIDREQFGRPISTFQAVRHRLAETLVAIEAAEAIVGAAGETPLPELAAAAKAFSGRSARTAARHCQQVLAGIGFTAEHPFHRYFRRVLLLDQLFGSASTLTKALGEELLRSRQLPALLPL